MKALLRLILIACVVAEVGIVFELLVTGAGIVMLPNLVHRRDAQATISLQQGAPACGFTARIPNSRHGTFRFNPPGTFFFSSEPVDGQVTLGPLRIDGQTWNRGLQPRSAATGAAIFDHVDSMLVLRDPETAASAIRYLAWPIGIGLMWSGILSFGIINLLRGMIQSVRLGEVFTKANIRRVFAIGWALVAYSLLGSVIHVWGSYRMQAWLISHFDMGGAKLPSQDSSGHPPLLLVGLLVLAMAEVFRRGLVLQEESRLTI